MSDFDGVWEVLQQTSQICHLMPFLYAPKWRGLYARCFHSIEKITEAWTRQIWKLRSVACSIGGKKLSRRWELLCREDTCSTFLILHCFLINLKWNYDPKRFYTVWFVSCFQVSNNPSNLVFILHVEMKDCSLYYETQRHGLSFFKLCVEYINELSFSLADCFVKLIRCQSFDYMSHGRCTTCCFLTAVERLSKKI